MRMPTFAKCMRVFACVGVFAIAVALSGCPPTDKKPAKQKTEKVAPIAKPSAEPRPGTKAEEQSNTAGPESSEKDLPEDVGQLAEKPRDLGPPLVENPAGLIRLDPKQPVWVDRKNKHVVLQGEVCKAGYPLEFFATYSNRSYEAAVSVNVTPSIVHAGLLAVGAVPGHPAQFQPNFVPPTGTEVAIEVRWKDAKGAVQSDRAQNWIRNIKTRKALDSNWVFAGSEFVTDETTGKKYYQADSGELICVLSLPTAMLDLPIRSYGAIEARLFEAFEEHLPPPSTPITILLKPILSAKSGAPGSDVKPAEKPAAANDKHVEAEKKAIEAAEPWLALVDQAQYAKSWETAAEYLKNAVGRREFVKSLNAARKPLGELKSRELQSKVYATSVPGAPDGQYVIVQYKTSFANRKTAVETITPMLDKDKKWKVSGYYIK